MSSQEINPKLEFIKTLEILAVKLNKFEYERVTSTMFSLYCGLNFGFSPVADPYLLPTIKKVWDDSREKRLNKLATVKKFVVYEGTNEKKE